MFLRPKILQLRSSPGFYRTVRTFLSDEFRCTTEWNSRLSAPFMERVRLENFYYDIDQTFQQQGKANAIDIDIFINKAAAATESHVDEITNLLHRLRTTEEATNTLDSTSHAVVRNLIELGQVKELISILESPLQYGVFLDQYSASFALNALIKQGDYHSAARIATFLMLQEDFSNELSRALSLYACYKYLEKCEPFYEEVVAEVATGKPAKKKEEIKVRVKFLRNEFFDDHFDIKDNKHLVGKTFASIGGNLLNPLGLNIRLLGYTLYQKYDKALSLLQTKDSVLYKDIVDYCLKSVVDVSDESSTFSDFKSALENISASQQLDTTNIEGELKKVVETTVQKCETTEIQKQKDLYKLWNEVRKTGLNDELERLQRAQRLQEVESLAKEMDLTEQKLWFFENEDQLDLEIDGKKVYYRKKWFGKKKKPRMVDEDYVPPEIIKHRN